MNREIVSATQISPTSALAHVFNAYDLTDEKRTVAEIAVRRIFRKTYNADIKEFLPLLFTLENQDKVSAVIGLRNAERESLFVENYLSSPVDDLIGNLPGAKNIHRSDIVEIGNLVSNFNGASYFLFVVLAFALNEAGIKWVAFTMTPVVEKIIARLQMEPIVICHAQQHAVANSTSNWGSYYESAPKVCVGNVEDACALLLNDRKVSRLREYYQNDVSALANHVKRGRFNG